MQSFNYICTKVLKGNIHFFLTKSHFYFPQLTKKMNVLHHYEPTIHIFGGEKPINFLTPHIHLRNINFPSVQ